MFEVNPHLLDSHLPQMEGNVQPQLPFPQRALEYPRHRFPRQWNGVAWNRPLPTEQTSEKPPSLGKVLVVATGVVGLGYLVRSVLSGLMNPERQRTCSICGRDGHDRRACPYAGPRRRFSRVTPKSRRCQCCGLYGYPTKAHHPRGRADDSDRLDVCDECHVSCGHNGHFRNFAIKPRFCRVLGRPSFWRN
jgi:hypothetical protein